MPAWQCLTADSVRQPRSWLRLRMMLVCRFWWRQSDRGRILTRYCSMLTTL